MKSILGIWTSLPVARRYKAWVMVIGVVGWGSVQNCWCRDWGGRGTSSPRNSIGELLIGEYLCPTAASRVVYGLSSGIDPNIGLLLINPPEDRCLLCLCSPSISVILIETLLIDGTSWWLSPPPEYGKHGSCRWSSSGFELG